MVDIPYIPSQYQRPVYLRDSERAHPGGNGPVDHGPTAADDARKSKWHYDRAGVVTKGGKMAKKRPGSFERGALYDFRARVKDMGGKSGLRDRLGAGKSEFD